MNASVVRQAQYVSEEMTSYQQHNLNIINLSCVFVCVQYVHFLQQLVSVSIRYVLIITYNVLSPAASTQLCSAVPWLNKTKSLSLICS